jgi:hypothetical protein
MAAVALTSAGLVAGGVVVAGQLASADDEPALAPAASGPPPETTPQTTAPAEDGPVLDGEIVIDVGDGDPITIDLGEIGNCIDLPIFELPEIDRAPEPPDLGGGHVVVASPDGVQVVDFGDGDGSVTITKSGDDISIETDGDVFEHSAPEMPEMPTMPDFPDLADLHDCLDQ